MITATPPRGRSSAVLREAGRAGPSTFWPLPPAETTHLISTHPTVITHGASTLGNHLRAIPAFNNEEINCVPHV